MDTQRDEPITQQNENRTDRRQCAPAASNSAAAAAVAAAGPNGAPRSWLKSSAARVAGLLSSALGAGRAQARAGDGQSDAERQLQALLQGLPPELRGLIIDFIGLEARFGVGYASRACCDCPGAGEPLVSAEPYGCLSRTFYCIRSYVSDEPCASCCCRDGTSPNECGRCACCRRRARDSLYVEENMRIGGVRRWALGGAAQCIAWKNDQATEFVSQHSIWHDKFMEECASAERWRRGAPARERAPAAERPFADVSAAVRNVSSLDGGASSRLYMSLIKTFVGRYANDAHRDEVTVHRCIRFFSTEFYMEGGGADDDDDVGDDAARNAGEKPSLSQRLLRLIGPVMNVLAKHAVRISLSDSSLLYHPVARRFVSPFFDAPNSKRELALAATFINIRDSGNLDQMAEYGEFVSCRRAWQERVADAASQRRRENAIRARMPAALTVDVGLVNPFSWVDRGNP